MDSLEFKRKSEDRGIKMLNIYSTVETAIKDIYYLICSHNGIYATFEEYKNKLNIKEDFLFKADCWKSFIEN